jgi:signal transduction histidine kinase
MKPRLSIAMFFVLFSLGLLCVFGLISGQFFLTSLTEIQDDQLRELAAYLKTEIKFEHGKPVLRLEEEEDPVAVTRGASIQLFDQNRSLAFQYGRIAPVTLHSGFSDQMVSGHVVRVMGTPLANGTWLQLELPTAEKTRALGAYNNMLKVFLPVAMILVCISSFYFSGFVLAPIERSLQELRRFMAELGHELRTPVTIALSNIQAMQIDVAEPRYEPQRLEAAERALLRMKNLVENLLLLAKSQNASIVFRMETVDLARISKKIVQQFEELFAVKAISLTYEGDTAFAKLDVEAITRVIENLLENALRYTSEGGSVVVNVRSQSGNAVFSVSDTGIGISKDLQAKVFEQFFRVEESRDRHTGGAGLGLSIVKSIVESHGGRVWLESELGKGSKFCFEIPAAG